MLEDTTDNKPPFDYVVGIIKGGLVPAMLISHHLKKPMATACVDDNCHLIIPEIHGEMVSGEGRLPPPPTLLLIDGKTNGIILQLKEFYEKSGHNVITATLYHRKTFSKVYEPDYVYHETDVEDILFPWE